jgi:hypothetical protein
MVLSFFWAIYVGVSIQKNELTFVVFIGVSVRKMMQNDAR